MSNTIDIEKFILTPDDHGVNCADHNFDHLFIRSLLDVSLLISVRIHRPGDAFVLETGKILQSSSVIDRVLKVIKKKGFTVTKRAGGCSWLISWKPEVEEVSERPNRIKKMVDGQLMWVEEAKETES